MNDLPTAGLSNAVAREIADAIVDPSYYADERIYDVYRWLRTNNPVALVDHPDYDPFWLITRFEDIRAVEKNSQVFRNAGRPFVLMGRKTIEQLRSINNGEDVLADRLSAMDGAEHLRYRLITQSWFAPKNLKHREVEIRDIAKRAIAALKAKGARCDFVQDLALKYPLHVIMNILGIPEKDEQMMLKLTQELLGTKDPDYTGLDVALDGAVEADYLRNTILEFQRYFTQLSNDRRIRPQNDLASIIANASFDGLPIGQNQEFGYYISIATAGHDTTSSSTATALWQLAANPEEFAKVKADPSLIGSLIEEAVRWAAPVKHFMRTAAHDTELCGRRIAGGDWIMLCYGSANRDEAAIRNPDVFSIEKTPKSHLAFGYGPHLCLGQHLAKLEMKILFEELIPQIKSLSLAGDPTRMRTFGTGGPRSVPLDIIYE